MARAWKGEFVKKPWTRAATADRGLISGGGAESDVVVGPSRCFCFSYSRRSSGSVAMFVVHRTIHFPTGNHNVAVHQKVPADEVRFDIDHACIARAVIIYFALLASGMMLLLNTSPRFRYTKKVFM